jgi:AraC-like DNA-binding protein
VGINSNDPELIQKYLDQTYATRFHIHRPDGDESPCALVHSRIDVDTFAIEEARHSGEVVLSADRMPGVIALYVLRGRVEVEHGGVTAGAGQGEWVLASTGLGSVRARSSDAQLRAVVVDRALLAEVAAIDTESPAVPLFTGLTPTRPTSGHVLETTERFLDRLLAADGAVNDPLVLRSAGRMLASALLAAFPNDLPLDSTGEEAYADQPALLRQAVDFIRDNASRDISVRDIAAALYLSPRTVQYLFRRHLNTTPTAYLRSIRLAQARKELIAGARSMTTVAATAARWGFAHTGRFAVLYRRTSGEPARAPAPLNDGAWRPSSIALWTTATGSVESGSAAARPVRTPIYPSEGCYDRHRSHRFPAPLRSQRGLRMATQWRAVDLAVIEMTGSIDAATVDQVRITR